MGEVVFVHGVGHDNRLPQEVLDEWLGSLTKGLVAMGSAEGRLVAAHLLRGGFDRDTLPTVEMAFYGGLFRQAEAQGVTDAADRDAASVADALAEALLRSAAKSADERTRVEAGRALAQLDPPNQQGAGDVVRRAASVLDDHPWLANRIFGAAQRIWPMLVQVGRYFTDQKLRECIRRTVLDQVGESTRIVVAHSLGTVVAFEVCARLQHSVDLLLTLGSPLGLDTVIYPRLDPTARFPSPAIRWVNIAHTDDIVAVEPHLAALFPSDDGRKVIDHALKSRRAHHCIKTYLEEEEVARVICASFKHC